jgi:hypothetical protein
LTREYFLATGIWIAAGTLAFAQQLEPGFPNKPLPGDNNQVWESGCPVGTRPVSGTCGVIDESNSQNEILHSFGTDSSNNAWFCT